MSMRVERSSLDQVKKRFEVNKKKLEEKQKEYDFEERLKELREEVRWLGQATPPAGQMTSEQHWLLLFNAGNTECFLPEVKSGTTFNKPNVDSE